MGRRFTAGLSLASLLAISTAAHAELTDALPDSADAAIELSEPSSAMSIRIRLLDAAPTRKLDGQGEIVYPRAVGGADLVRREVGEGFEDVVRYPTRPEAERVAYSVELHGVAGVRLASNTVEFLDDEGVPQLRMAPPSVTDAHGVEHDADVTIEGCAHSLDLGVPWKHPVLPPDSTSCLVEVHWSVQAYPAELDPTWTLTKNNMVMRRSDFAMIRVGDDILALGGITDFAKRTVTKSVEVYDPKENKWTLAKHMKHRRSHFDAVLLKDGSSLLLAGDCCLGPNDCPKCNGSSAEIYNVESGSTTSVPLNDHEWAVTRIAKDAMDPSDPKVLVFGGTSAVADVYDTGDKTWKTEPVPWTNGLFDFTATQFVVDPDDPEANGILVCGGKDGHGQPQTACYVRQNGSWTPSKPLFHMHHARYGHTATWLAHGGENGTGAVFLVGGDDAGGTTERWTPGDPGTTAGPPLMSPRRYHAAALRVGGILIVSGGEISDRASVTNTSEGLPDPPTSWFERDDMNFPRSHHSMLLVDVGGSNPPLLAAGGRSARALDSAELLTPLKEGSSCTHDSECEQEHCNNFVCCSCPSCQICNGPTEHCTSARPGATDTRCEESGDPHHCQRHHACEGGVCKSEDCHLRACGPDGCETSCHGSAGCAPGAACVEEDGKGVCVCRNSSACEKGEVCLPSGKCGQPFEEPNRQVSCELAEPTAGVGASVLICAIALAARRRRQKGKSTKACGVQSTNGS